VTPSSPRGTRVSPLVVLGGLMVIGIGLRSKGDGCMATWNGFTSAGGEIMT
jgi:hypothetical protein